MGLPAPGTEMARLTSAQVDIWLLQVERERAAKSQVVRPLDPAILGSGSSRSALYRTIFTDNDSWTPTVAPTAENYHAPTRPQINSRTQARQMRIIHGNPRTPPAACIPLDNARLLRAIAVVRRDFSVGDDDFTRGVRGVIVSLEQIFRNTPDMPRTLVDLDMSRYARQIQNPLFPTDAIELVEPDEDDILYANGNIAAPLQALSETRLRFRVHLLDAIRQNYDHVLNHGAHIMEPRNADSLPPMGAYRGWRWPLPDPEILTHPIGSYLDEYERMPDTANTDAGSTTSHVATIGNIPQDLSLFFPPPRLLGLLLSAWRKFEQTPLHSRIQRVTAKPITTQTWCYILSEACEDHPQLEAFIQVFVALNPELAQSIIRRGEGPHARTFVYGERGLNNYPFPEDDDDYFRGVREPNPDNLQVPFEHEIGIYGLHERREVYIP